MIDVRVKDSVICRSLSIILAKLFMHKGFQEAWDFEHLVTHRFAHKNSLMFHEVQPNLFWLSGEKNSMLVH